MKARHLALLAMLSCAPAAHAQQWLVDNAINNQIMETAICDSALRKHERLPDVCAKYPRYGGKVTPGSGAAPVRAASPTATLFTPVAGSDAVKQLADSLGNSPEERRQILQLAGAGKEMFALKYKGKWRNTIAGAMTFFIAAVATVQSEREPDADAQRQLFDSLNATLAQSDIARASDKDKTALYDVLLASAGLPLVFYVDGKQNGNAAQVEQAKAMAAGFSRKLMHVEPQALAAMLQAANGGGRIDGGADVVGFRGGAYDGWRGARVNDAIVFRKEDHSQPLPGETVRNGDIRCGRHG